MKKLELACFRRNKDDTNFANFTNARRGIDDRAGAGLHVEESRSKVHFVEARVERDLYKYKGGEEGLFTMVAPRFSRENLG